MMSKNQIKSKEQVKNRSDYDDKNILITIFYEKLNLKKNIYCNKDKKLLYCFDKFCKKIKKINDDSFFTEFNFFIKEKMLDPSKTIKENKILPGCIILAQDKPKAPSIISLKVKDLENRKIPREIDCNRKIKEDLKHLCGSLNLNISNTLFLCKDQKIDLDQKVKDMQYLEDNEVIAIAQKNPTFTIFVENVPCGAKENELIEFFQDCQPISCEIYAAEQEAVNIPNYATLSFESESNAFFAIAKCSKDEFQKHKMIASIQSV